MWPKNILGVVLRLIPYLISGCAIGASFAAVMAVREMAGVVVAYREGEERDRQGSALVWRQAHENQAQMIRELDSVRGRVGRLERFVDLFSTRVDGDFDSPESIRSAAGTGR